MALNGKNWVKIHKINTRERRTISINRRSVNTNKGCRVSRWNTNAATRRNLKPMIPAKTTPPDTAKSRANEHRLDTKYLSVTLRAPRYKRKPEPTPLSAILAIYRPTLAVARVPDRPLRLRLKVNGPPPTWWEIFPRFPHGWMELGIAIWFCPKSEKEFRHWFRVRWSEGCFSTVFGFLFTHCGVPVPFVIKYWGHCGVNQSDCRKFKAFRILKESGEYCLVTICQLRKNIGFRMM